MRWALAAALLLAPLASQAAGLPHPGGLDPRIQTVAYDPDQVVLLRGTPGYQFMLEFAANEKIETVSIGDSLGWQVTPNRKADVLFIKPISQSTVTNLTVLTDLRRYAFELRVAPPGGSDPILYIARMTYPQPAQAVAVETPPPPQAETAPVATNNAYSIKGSASLFPVRIFDDGHMTYFELAKDSAVPAIFAVSQDKSESLVNYLMRGPYIVVDQLSARFKLRSGKEVATVENYGPSGVHDGKNRP